MLQENSYIHKLVPWKNKILFTQMRLSLRGSTTAMDSTPILGEGKVNSIPGGGALKVLFSSILG